ncbi:MAG: hypothetical protein N4A57_14190 [Anaeromicrobium sp.]|jgi:hypothetical protein|uniref:hypothetical protein n=1 Tax=Anaeromicrobium sp. TaxID=1929132 RepID=UPI0025E741E6|nr:hypothetical protein [Anaeromicrobium sp.]MCT4595397.1 hypothetical protein [Anaeromicrobium sp.]
MKNRFKVIEGYKDKEIKKEYKFVKAMATNTRLMGVVGVYIQWKDHEQNNFHQLFHLDYEEYGIDNYKGVTEDNILKTEILKMMGGLGGDLVEITLEEAKFLIKKAIEKNPVESKEWIDQIENFHMIDRDNGLNEQEEILLLNKICIEVSNTNELINYYIMRSVGIDRDGIRYLSNNEMKIDFVKKPSILLKNTVEKLEEDKYIVESIIDLNGKYKLVVSEIRLKNKKVYNIEIKSQMRISPQEAAFSLRKREYIMLYLIKDKSKFLELIEKKKPHGMINDYEGGTLITEFNSNNNHVKEDIYYLSGDIRGIYYITDSNQLVVGAYDEKRAAKISEELEVEYKDLLINIKNIHLENSIIYQFVHSGETNILDFIYEDK